MSIWAKLGTNRQGELAMS